MYTWLRDPEEKLGWATKLDQFVLLVSVHSTKSEFEQSAFLPLHEYHAHKNWKAMDLGFGVHAKKWYKETLFHLSHRDWLMTASLKKNTAMVVEDLEL